MNLRTYTPADFETVRVWAANRGCTLTPQMLSPNGFLLEDETGPLGVAWVYLTFDVPVAAVDNFITRPGLGVRATRDIWRRIWRTVLDFLHALRDTEGKPLHYRTVKTNVRASFVKFMAAEGWKTDPTPLRQIVYEIQN